jgi:hypothetical protein
MLDPNNFLSSVSLRHPGILLDYPISDLISLYCIILSQTQPDSHLALSKIEWLWLQRADIDEKHKAYFERVKKSTSSALQHHTAHLEPSHTIVAHCNTSVCFDPSYP